MKISMLMRLEGLVRALRQKGHAIASKVETGRGTSKSLRRQKSDPAVKGKVDERGRT